MTFLTLKNARKSYGGIPALAEACLEIEAGETHALMGENGAGKSTLIKILAGVVAPDNIDIALDNSPVKINNPDDAHAAGFRFIHQELNIVPHLSVAENIVLGQKYPTRFAGAIDWRALNEGAEKALKTLQVDHIDPTQKTARLSTGDQMLVRIASTLLSMDGSKARLYVMDEPTAALTGVEAEKLFQVITGLKTGGASILYVSHRMDEVMRICDRVTVFRDGAHVETKPLTQTSKDEIITFMTGREVKDAYPSRQSPVGERVIVSAQKLTTANVRHVNVEVKSGEILGVAGLANAGQSQFLHAILGDDKRLEGALDVRGGANLIKNPATAWANKLAYIPKERRREGLMLNRSVMENITLPHLNKLGRAFGLVDRKAERRHSTDLGHKVKLKSAGLQQPCYQLSGGNQQKVVFARALGDAPELLLLDEPTRGVDVGAKFDIYSLIREMSAKGTAVIMTSSDLPELLGMCDRILIMQDGQQQRITPTKDVSAAQLLAMFYE